MQHLRRHQCRVLREGGGHTLVVNLRNGRQATVPRHSEIATFTMRDICKQLDVPAPGQA